MDNDISHATQAVLGAIHDRLDVIEGHLGIEKPVPVEDTSRDANLANTVQSQSELLTRLDALEARESNQKLLDRIAELEAQQGTQPSDPVSDPVITDPQEVSS